MACLMNCLNGGVCSSNQTCACLSCYIGSTCEININVIGYSLTSSILYDIEHSANGATSVNIAKLIYVTVFAVMLLCSLINNIICLQTFFLFHIRLTNCGLFQIFYCSSALLAVIGLQFRIIAALELDKLTKSFQYVYATCNVVPIIVISLGDICLWLSALIVIEFLLLEIFDFHSHRTRWFSLIASIITIVLVVCSHIHEMLFRHLIVGLDPSSGYICAFSYSLTIRMVDKVLRTSHVAIPCSIHLIGSFLMLIRITIRSMKVRCQNNYFRTFIHQCNKRKHFFFPPFIILLSNLPHLLLHVTDLCQDIRNSSLLRLHVAFNILIYLPPTFPFFIYIYPSKSYMKKFQESYIGRKLTSISKIKTTFKKSTVNPFKIYSLSLELSHN